MPDANLFQILSVVALPLLFAITVHEASHGWVANRLGDPTAKMMGRLTLNPIRHIDPIGTIAVPLIILFVAYMSTGFPLFFGWAKPVPITAQNLHNPKRDMRWVALAGPGSNLFMALLWAILAYLALNLPIPGRVWLYEVGRVGILINLVLMLLNLIPLPPLDGGRVLVSVLPGPLAYKVSRVEPYGIVILFAVLFFLNGWYYFSYAVQAINIVIKSLFGLPI
ncbi:MAG: site-2 protease family protein [Gammaproteobacteria bacterium]|nr:site-2 protease family protein [Gammaproteobacteria bacterium]